MSQNRNQNFRQQNDVRGRSNQDDINEIVKIHMKPCKFWKAGRCNWGWGCRFFHGENGSDDPRRSEYRGPPVDFTQFPRVGTNYVNQKNQNSVVCTTLRKPCVQIYFTSSFVQSRALQELCQKNGIDVLNVDQRIYYDNETIKNKVKENLSDYVLLVDNNEVTVYPSDEIMASKLIPEWIKNDWNKRNYNLSLGQLELMTSKEVHDVIAKLTKLDKIDETMSSLQDETSIAVTSSLTQCKFSKEDLSALQGKLACFFSKLNVANSSITDIPVYSPPAELEGVTVNTCSSTPIGLSIEARKVLEYTIGSYLTQIHMCLNHVYKMIEEVNNELPPGLTSSNNSTPGLHPTPFCPPPCGPIVDGNFRSE